MISLFRRKPVAARSPSVPDGCRAYAIGDVHGRADLLDDLLGRIERDNAARGPARTIVILLGDLIDRGPRSSAAVERAMAPLSWAELIVLKGNHEATMCEALADNAESARLWMQIGGRATLRSWRLDDDDADLVGAHGREQARQRVGDDVIAWMNALPSAVTIGDYHFVHAGVRPGVPLDEQAAADQIWIRQKFLRSKRWHGAMVVHGHHALLAVEERFNRIGIDTGAYATGRLTAIGLEGSERWYLQTGEASE
jgi:serine/threonine protein phosphatase 1